MITLNPTKHHKYYRVWTSDTYRAEIYDNCYSRIAVRGDGNRARIRIDGTQWRGNTGGYHLYEYYIDGREAVVRMMRQLRQLQVRALKAGYPKTDYAIADALANGDYGQLYF